MKRLISKIRAVLGNTSGISLMEGIVSILILTVLIVTITMMIVVALRFTHASLDGANAMQGMFNIVQSAQAAGDPADVVNTQEVITFTFPGDREMQTNVYMRQQAGGGFRRFWLRLSPP